MSNDALLFVAGVCVCGCLSVVLVFHPEMRCEYSLRLTLIIKLPQFAHASRRQ